MTNGFSNWKDATVSFNNHELSIFQKEAVMMMVTLPSTTPDIGELLSKQHAAVKLNSQHCLFQIMLCVRFMGLAFRGDEDETISNFKQIVNMKAEDDPALKNYKNRQVMICGKIK